MTILSYSIFNYDDIQKDITMRSKILFDYKSMIERRLKIESEYLSKMRELASCPEMKKIPNSTKATEFLYNSLINTFHAEVDNIAAHSNRLENEIGIILSTSFVELEAEAKKQLQNFYNTLKDYERRYNDVDHQKAKMIKKAHELKKLREEYIVSLLVDSQFERKNKLFIKGKDVKESYDHLSEEVRANIKAFNQKALTTADKLNQTISNLEEIENQKVEMMKKVFMILQISNSEYGANLVQQKTTILNRINQLQAANPEFLKCLPEDADKNRKDLEIQLEDPCFYINKLYTNVVDTKNLQSLVMFGQEQQHKMSISESMSMNSESSQATQLLEETESLQTVKLVAQAFKNIFDQSAEIDQSKIDFLKQMIRDSYENRKNFILCLQGFRKHGIFYLPQKKIGVIVESLNYFLDQCLINADTYNSKLLLVLSLTYKVRIGEESIELQTFIKDHHIWKQKEWWECALLESSFEEIKIKPTKKSNDVPITIWHIKGAGLKQSEGENELTTHQILFNQLHFYIFNMSLFSTKEQYRSSMAKKYFKQFLLNSKRWKDIDNMLCHEQTNNEDCENEPSYQSGGSPLFSNKKKTSRKLF